MKYPSAILSKFFCIISAFFLCSCATTPKPSPDLKQTAYIAEKGKNLFSSYSPLFVVENNEISYNRIGTPRALHDAEGKEVAFVDPETPTIYFQKQTFKAEKGSYTNLIYRIHFEKIPYSHITAGKNIGLFVVVTLNDRQEPVLYTTVHTCGCYLAFIPTSYLPEESYPDDWDKESQSVFGEHLPGALAYPEVFNPGLKSIILLRTDVHRVMDLWLEESELISNKYKLVQTRLKSIEELKKLPVDGGGTTSFYETSGSRRGYVKNSHKPWERLFMSWWSMDWRIGEDKILGDSSETGTIFFTSIKFWAREESDMWKFGNFLEYWGWKF